MEVTMNQGSSLVCFLPSSRNDGSLGAARLPPSGQELTSGVALRGANDSLARPRHLPDDPFEAQGDRLYRGTRMVSRDALPLLTAAPVNPASRLVTRQRRGLRVAVPADRGIHRRRRYRTSSHDHFVALPSVAGAGAGPGDRLGVPECFL